MTIFEICAIAYVAIQIIWIASKLQLDIVVSEWYREASYREWYHNECRRRVGVERAAQQSDKNLRLDSLRADFQIRDFESLNKEKINND
jgi:hypothetical protein